MTLLQPSPPTRTPARRWYDAARADRAEAWARLMRWHALGLEPCLADHDAASDAEQLYRLALRSLHTERRAAARERKARR